MIFIDYGNRERVKANKLRVLPDHLTLLPAQAICCALAEVKGKTSFSKSCNLWADKLKQPLKALISLLQEEVYLVNALWQKKATEMTCLLPVF